MFPRFANSEDEDDNLPDIPTTEACPLSLAEQQMRRLAALEEQLKMMKQPLTPWSSEDGREEQTQPATSSPAFDTGVNSALSLDTERLLSELRAAVPHLSAQFSCSYQDCHLLLAAIRSGSAVAVPGQLSVAQRLQVLESENRGLQHKSLRQQDTEQTLRDELAAAHQAMNVTREDTTRRTTLLSQRAEESRKQLLMEEGRSQRLQVKVRQLEVELDTLRDKLRGQLR